MRTKFIPSFLYIAYLLVACQTATPPTVAAILGTEFSLSPSQSATVADRDLTITLHSVLSDDRCPSEVECAATGPVTVSLSVQQGNSAPSDLTLQTFTDQDGRAPAGQFEGIQNIAEAGDYLIQIVGVLPYPKNLDSEIKVSDYRVTFIVTQN
ncbi:MAG TPA: hypothetical protein VFM05_03755 [Candidatus Saccharimonadales bacterium]|nr:hypothetical protein [Candidatus Saccharimonadales bacterium]